MSASLRGRECITLFPALPAKDHEEVHGAFRVRSILCLPDTTVPRPALW